MTDDLVFSNLISRYVKYDLDNEYSIKEQKKEFISFVLHFLFIIQYKSIFSRYGEETFCFVVSLLVTLCSVNRRKAQILWSN